MDSQSNSQTKRQVLTNYIFIATAVAILGVAGYFFKLQSDQIDQLTRIEEAQKSEIEHFRKQMKTLTDQELVAKSKQDAAVAAATKLASDEAAQALSREQDKLQILIQQRQRITGGNSQESTQSSEKDDRARLKILQDDLRQLTTLQHKDGGILKSVNSESQVAHKAELTALNQRHQQRLNQIKADQQQINHFNQQISALNRQRKSNSAAAGEIAGLTTNIHQTQLDIGNLRSTEQSDQDNYRRTKKGFEENTADTQSEIKTEQSDLQSKIKSAQTEIASLQKRLSGIHDKQGTTKAELAGIDAQIKIQESMIQEMQNKMATANAAAVNSTAANPAAPSPSAANAAAPDTDSESMTPAPKTAAVADKAPATPPPSAKSSATGVTSGSMNPAPKLAPQVPKKKDSTP